MTDKELNQKILNQLYPIAEEVWATLEKHERGSFTAKQVDTGLNSSYWRRKFYSGENYTEKEYTVSAGSYQCTFTSSGVFSLVNAFETLVRIGSKRRLFQSEDASEATATIHTDAGTATAGDAKKENTNTDAATAANDSKKFTFAAVGVKPGDYITFIDGTEVTATDNNRVLYCGKVYTLSGFCKAYMPYTHRTKSNSYRGCAFFYLDGVKLEQIFKHGKTFQSIETERLKRQSIARRIAGCA